MILFCLHWIGQPFSLPSHSLFFLIPTLLEHYNSEYFGFVRYVALTMLMKAISVDAQAVQRHRVIILECVKVFPRIIFYFLGYQVMSKIYLFFHYKLPVTSNICLVALNVPNAFNCASNDRFSLLTIIVSCSFY